MVHEHVVASVLVQRFQKAFFLQLVENRVIDESPRICSLGAREFLHSFENGFYSLNGSSRDVQHIFRLECVSFLHFVATLCAGPFLNHFDGEVFVFKVSFHAFKKAAHEALRRIALTIDKALARDQCSRDVGFADFRHVEELCVAEVLRANVAGNRNRCGVNYAIHQTLNQKSHFVQLHNGHVGRGIEVPHFRASRARARRAWSRSG